MNPISYNPNQAENVTEVFLKTPLDGLYYMPLKSWKDERGAFVETGRVPEIEEVSGEKFHITQLNLSISKTHVIRGFHAEGWNKLVTVTHGTALCALADIRPNSKTFSQVVTFKLGQADDAHFGSLYISQGIANSFFVIEGPLLYSYAVDRLYKNRNHEGDIAINLFDPDLNVTWPIPKKEMIISQRDLNTISLREKFPEKFSD